MKKISRRIFAAGAVLGTTTLTTPALAQMAGQTPPPVFQQVDNNGVELETGKVVKVLASISIGPRGPGSLGFDWSTDNSAQGGPIGYIISGESTDGSKITQSVTIAGSTETFSAPIGTTSYIQDQGRPSTLSYNSATATFTYTGVDGSVAVFNVGPIFVGRDTQGYNVTGTGIASLTYPEGQVLNYYYTYDSPFYDLQAITSSLGYQLRFTRSSGWIVGAVVFNMNSEACDPTAASCTLAGSWPSLTWDSTKRRIVDSTGDWVQWTESAGQLVLTYPSGRTLTYNGGYDANNYEFYASSFTDGKGTWSYQFPNQQYGGGVSLIFNPENNAPRALQWSITSGLYTSDTIYDGITDTSLTTSYGYDSTNRLTSVTRTDGTKFTYAYDARGNLNQVHQVSTTPGTPADIVTSAVFPSTCSNAKTCNQPTSVTDANGNTTMYTYNSNSGGVATVTYPAVGSGTPKITYTYTAENAKYKNGSGTIVTGSTVYLPTKTVECISGSTCTTANQAVTAVAYDPNQALMPSSVTHKSGDGSLSATTAYTYTGNGDVNTIDGPLSGTADTTRNYYDAMRRPLGSIGPLPGNGQARRAVRTTYDDDGRPVTVDAGTAAGQGDSDLANMTSLQQEVTTYDAQGRMATVKARGGGGSYAMMQRSYSDAGLPLCSRVLMNGSEFSALPPDPCVINTTGTPDRITHYAHDGYLRTTSVTSGYGSTDPSIDVTNTYDSLGRLASVKDANNNVTTYSYDGMNRLQKTCYADSSSDCEQYTYDANGNIYSRTVRSGAVINYRYDALNRLTLKDSASFADISYGYNNIGWLTSAKFSSSGLGITNTYDALGRVASSSSNADGTARSMSYGYDLAGRRTSVTWPTASGVPDLTATYSYLTTGEVSSIADGATNLAAYSYDALGNRSKATYGNGVVTTYAYDPVSRLTSLTNDLAGTANDLTIGGTSTPITYDAASEITSAKRSNDAYAFPTSQIGNVSRAYTSNSLNQYTAAGPASFTYDANGNLTGDGTWAYTYDAENRLTKAVGAGTTANLSYDPLGRLYEIGGSPIGDRSFAYDGDEIAADYVVSTGSLYHRYVFGPGVDEPIVEYDSSGNRTWLIADEHGSIVARPDANGNASPSRINTYDEYGIPGATNSGRFQYTGQAYLYEIGLDYYKNRIYSPTLGRFLQTDPIGYGDGPNWYAYAHDDSVNEFDPTGLDSMDDWCAANGGCAPATASYGPNGSIVITAMRSVFSSTPGPGGGTTYDCGDFGCDMMLGDPVDLFNPGDGAEAAAIARIRQQLQAAARSIVRAGQQLLCGALSYLPRGTSLSLTADAQGYGGLGGSAGASAFVDSDGNTGFNMRYGWGAGFGLLAGAGIGIGSTPAPGTTAINHIQGGIGGGPVGVSGSYSKSEGWSGSAGATAGPDVGYAFGSVHGTSETTTGGNICR